MTNRKPNFTIEEIRAAHAKAKTGADFPGYIRDIKKLGVHHYDYHVENGSNVYFDKDGNYVSARPAETIQRTVSDNASPDMLKKYLLNHQQGGSDYPTFCRQAAETGVERWTSNLEKMVCAYYDKQNNELYAEPIPEAKY